MSVKTENTDLILKDAFTAADAVDVRERYSKRYEQFGYSPLTLGWNKNRQAIRFDVLTSEYDFNKKHVLDIGCGFGDLNQTLQHKTDRYEYTGVDLVGSLLNEANQRYACESVQFMEANILDMDSITTYDYAVASGVFNHKLSGDTNYEFIEQVIKKSLELCKDGLAFDFLSDKVDFKHEHTFHSSPEKILSIAFKYSRNVVLKNNYMPFEFSLFIAADDSFSPEDVIFNRFKEHTNN